MSRRGPKLPPPNIAGNYASHLRPFGGTAARAAPVFAKVVGGRWRGKVRVVPIEHLRSRGFPNGRAFAVICEWIGPPLPMGGERQRRHAPVDATDELVVGELELARRIAAAAAELLAEPTLPFLRELKESVSVAGDSWRRHYDWSIGDDARAAAEGY